MGDDREKIWHPRASPQPPSTARLASTGREPAWGATSEGVAARAGVLVKWRRILASLGAPRFSAPSQPPPPLGQGWARTVRRTRMGKRTIRLGRRPTWSHGPPNIERVAQAIGLGGSRGSEVQQDCGPCDLPRKKVSAVCRRFPPSCRVYRPAGLRRWDFLVVSHPRSILEKQQTLAQGIFPPPPSRAF